MKAINLGLAPRVFTVGSKPLSERPLWKKAVEAAFQVSPMRQSPVMSGFALGELAFGNYAQAAFFAAVATVFTLDGVLGDYFRKDGLFLKDNKISERLKARRATEETPSTSKKSNPTL